MSKSPKDTTSAAALRTVTAIQIHDARRVLQAARESLDTVAKANNVHLIPSAADSAPKNTADR